MRIFVLRVKRERLAKERFRGGKIARAAEQIGEFIDALGSVDILIAEHLAA